MSADPAAAGAVEAEEPRYGWVVVWATFVALAVIFGVAYSFAAFFEPSSASSAQRADVSLVFGLSGCSTSCSARSAACCPIASGPRVVVGAGMVCIAAGLWARLARR